MKIEEVEGIGPVFRERLRGANIQTTDDLLEAGRTPSGRDQLADASGISGAMLLQFVNHADLMRVSGVGSEYADLLEAAGVDTVVELSRRNADNLAAAMADYDIEKEIVRRVPSGEVVARWIDEAKMLGRTIEY